MPLKNIVIINDIVLESNAVKVLYGEWTLSSPNINQVF